jgi:hypothetical protein
MECPYCTETVRDEAIVCKHCCSDLVAARPVIAAIQDIVGELDVLQGELDRIVNEIAFIRQPVRFVAFHAAAYVLLPAAILIASHFLITVVLDVPLAYLRLASILVPLLFGIAACAINKVSLRAAAGLGAACAILSVSGMLVAIAYVDESPVLPENWREWREAIEYVLSIALAFITGSILVNFLLRILPSTIATRDRPNVLAYRLARLLGQHAVEETLRRRARRIQDLARKMIALAGLAATASASVYTGLKGIIGH